MKVITREEERVIKQKYVVRGPFDKHLKPGTQIISVPTHVNNLEDPACEPGFVTSGPTRDGAYFCRYWLKKDGKYELRTKANSELTPVHTLVVLETVPQMIVERAMERWC